MVTGRMPQVTICKSYHFSAGHWLPEVPKWHPCKRPHGHNYVVELRASGEMNQRQGWLVDFAELDRWMDPLIEKLDHRMLNDILPNPTAEWLAWWIKSRIPVKYARMTVRVWETPKIWAETKGTLPEWLREEVGWRITQEDEGSDSANT